MTRLTAKTVDIIETRAEMESLVGEIATLQHQQNAAKVALDQEVTAIRTRYEGRLDRLEQQIQQKFAVAEAWALSNPDEFGVKKSIDFVHATVGFRLGTPRVVKVGRFKDFAQVVQAMIKIPWAKKYVKQPEPQVNREALIADRRALDAQELRAVGIQIKQDERFYIDPKAETLEQGVQS